MKKIIASLLAVGIATGGAALLVFKPDLTFEAVNTVQNIIPRSSELDRAEVATRKVEVGQLRELGVEVNDCLLLVNTSHLLPDDFTPELVTFKDVPFERHTARGYAELSDAVSEKFGDKLYVSSTYRTAAEQEEILAEQGGETAQQVGASEHQTGLAIDVYVPYFAGEAFIKCEAGRWVNENCTDYGFIVRYPAGMSGVTGISYEPWHLRYVGAPHAEIITENRLALEDYAAFLGEGFREYDGWLVSHQFGGDGVEIPESFTECSVSADGEGGWFVTAKQ